MSVIRLHRPGGAGLNRRQRLVSILLAVGIAALSVLYLPTAPAAAAPPLCTPDEFPRHPIDCTKRLADVTQARAQCLDPPVPVGPSSGIQGIFASKPASYDQSGTTGVYSDYGYAGLRWHTYGLGCAGDLRNADDSLGTMIASGELELAATIIGAANALRDKAWSPGGMWQWADPLVQNATQRVYQQVFTVWGVVVLALVGLYLLWQSRKANMAKAVTTVGWALLVMVAVTAISRWPVVSAHVADRALTTSVTTLSDSLSIDQKDPSRCPADSPLPGACQDHRTPAVRASDTATEELLYRNWLRGLLGSADSPTAKKYGWALYQASALDWDEEADAANPDIRKTLIADKQQQWNKIAEQIRSEDPAAYTDLTGTNHDDRLGYGLFALISALCYAAFDIVASLMVLLGFLVVRWAVIAAPALGTVGMLQPASGAVKKLANAVVTSVINVVVFSVGGAAYVSATNLIMTSPGLASWLKLLLIVLAGAAGWAVLRKYRRVAGMAQWHDPMWMHRRMMRQLRRQGRRGRRTDVAVGEEIIDAVEDHGAAGGRPDGEEIRWGRHRARYTYRDDNAQPAGTGRDAYADERGLPSGTGPNPRPAPPAADRVDGGEVRVPGGRTVVVEIEEEAYLHRPGSTRPGDETGRPGFDEEA